VRSTVLSEAPSRSLRERALALHASSLVVDLHADTFISVRYARRDIAKRHATPVGWAPFMLHCDLPRWKEGGIKAQGLGVVATKLMTRKPRAHALETIRIMHATADANADKMAIVRSPDELESLRHVPLRPWAPGVRDHYVRIRPELLTGRRLRFGGAGVEPAP